MAKFFYNAFAVDGDKTTIPDDTQPSGSVSYETGFGADYQKELGVDPDAKPFPRAQFNQLMFDITDALRQYQTHGAPDFITTADNEGVPFPYEIYSLVRYNAGSGFKVYMSLVGTNTSLPSDATKWRVISDSGIPIGTMLDFGGTSLPTNYLLCDGTAVSRTTYAFLFTAIGTTWGVGDGSTTFNLPDFRRRTAVGSGGSGTAELGNATGNIGGSEVDDTLIEHNHGVTDAGHTHQCPSYDVGAGGGSFFGATAPQGALGHRTTDSAVTGITIDDEGAGTEFNIIQPSAVVTKIIKYA